jgi:integrase
VSGRREDHHTEAQVRALIGQAATFDKAFANLVEAAFFTGARLGELVGSDVRDFDEKGGTLRVRKGKTDYRIVTLTAEGAAFFKRASKGKLPTAILLPNADGARWGKSTQARPFKRAAKLAKLPASASFYSLRHTYISRAIENGMPLSLIADNCGTSLLMIQKNYQHVLAAIRKEKIEATAPKLRRVK